MANQMDLFKVVHSIDKSKDSKVCKKCKVEKPLTSFQTVAYKKDGSLTYKSSCNACRRPHKILLKETRKSMPVPEGHTCPICKSTLEQLVEQLSPQATTTQTFVLDHDHKTMTIRDYLCNKCNIALGNFDDDINLLRNAVSYLEEHEKKC